MKAALVLSKIKNDDIKTSERVIDEMKNNLLELKRQLLNEVRRDSNASRLFLQNQILIFRKKRRTN